MNTELKVTDRIELTKRGEAIRTAERLAFMAGEEAPHLVPWNKVFKTSEGNFRLVAELNKGRNRRKDPMRNFIERVE